MTKRLGLLLGSLVAFAACGGGGGNNNGTCGNGMVDGNETCDDGNTSSGDGCSATCKTEGSGACGNGTVDVNAGEQCDDSNTTNGDGCSSSCQNEIPVGCGNGTLDSGEQCDDHNNTNGDGCSATCRNEGSGLDGTCSNATTLTFAADTSFPDVMVANPTGDTSTDANSFAAADCAGDTGIGAGNDHTYKFTLPVAADVGVFSNLDQENFANAIRITTAACDAGTELRQNQDYLISCTEDAYFGLNMVSLPAGTYYITVDGVAAGDEGAYDLTVFYSATLCGNGMVDYSQQYSGEGCDDAGHADADGCSARCFVEDGYVCNSTDGPSVCALNTCGDGTIGGTEECDDLNTVNGDGCNSMCNLEYDVTETEPNDTTAQTLAAGSHRIKGSFTNGDDVDLYTFTIPSGGAHVEIETYTTIEANRPYQGLGDDRYDCKGNSAADTIVDIFDSTGDVTNNDTALVEDDDSGDLNDGGSYGCSYLGHDGTDTTRGDLAAGTYTLKVASASIAADASLGRYLVVITVTTGTPPPPTTGLVINEYMANDNDADTNCDGVHPTGSDTTDEFVEIVNTGTTSVDLTGMTLSDGAAVRHTFKVTDTTGSMTLAAGKAVVVWGGGAPACPGVTNWFVANSAQHTLGLNNTGGDTITLKSAGATPTVLAQTSYTAKPTPGVSANLNPDLTGTAYALHNAVTGHLGNFSPGKKSDGTAF